MIRILSETDNIFERRELNFESADGAAAEIIEAVKKDGDAAVLDYTERFDGVRPASLQVTEREIEEALGSLEPEFLKVLETSAENIRNFHKNQLRECFKIERDGRVLGQKITPLKRVGLYVPGGTASYPSTVLMNAIPAVLAGVGEIIMTTPPDRDGKIAPAILAAAKTAGVGQIFKCGGAQAVAAMAYGTKTICKVDKIVGPGNIYVAAAKRRVYGIVDIDMIAGPSEILIIADGKNDPAVVAGDMLSQAEHDKNASAVLITDSEQLAQEVSAELERQIPLLARRDICRASIDNNGKIIVVDDLNKAADISNEIAPEHLEIMTDDPFSFLELIKNAGSIFLGRNTPEALGDYFAGPNHTLPTNGTAKFSSPLSCDDFIKKSSFIYYSSEELKKAAPCVTAFAEREGLSAHAESVRNRLR